MSAVAKAKEIDRAWFKRHPKRKIYLRETIPGEFDGSDGIVMTGPDALEITSPEDFLAADLAARRVIAKAQGRKLYTVVRQVIPGSRLRGATFQKSMTREFLRSLTERKIQSLVKDCGPLMASYPAE